MSLALLTRDGVRIGSGPEKSGLSMKMEVRVIEIKIRTQTGPKNGLFLLQNDLGSFQFNPPFWVIVN